MVTPWRRVQLAPIRTPEWMKMLPKWKMRRPGPISVALVKLTPVRVSTSRNSSQ